MDAKKIIKLFSKVYTDNHYNVEISESDCTDIMVMVCIGRSYDSCEHERLNDSVNDAIDKFNLKHLGNIFATSSLLGSDKRVYVAFMDYKDIPSDELSYLKYAYENKYNNTNAKIYSKYLELNLDK